MDKRQIVLRGLWMSAIFWPYTHGGGFHYALILGLSPLWLALGDLWSGWMLRWVSWIGILAFEVALEWSSLPSFRHVVHTFTRSVMVLHSLSFANWNQISAHIATPLLLIGVLLGWQVYRQARTPARIGVLLVLGTFALAVNHVFWRLPAAGPLFAYGAIGLFLLSYSRVLRHLSHSLSARPAGTAVAALTVLIAMGIGWRLTPQPGHPSLGWLGPNLQDLRFFSATGATTGFSGGINHIGHSVVPDYRPVMIVHSAHPHYWQAEIYNTFTGKEWTDPGQNAVEITPEDSGIPLFGLPFNTSQVHSTTTTIQVQGLGGYKFRTLFYPGVPLSFSAQSSLVMYPGKEQFVSSSIAGYRVTSIIPQFTSRQLDSVAFGEYSAAAAGPDLQIPSNLSPAVAKLARTATRGATGPWQAAQDLKYYLDRHYRYSFVVTPTRINVVNHFLFTDKAGYCDQFSTAFIMMARTLGIPARWVAGYAPGTYEAKEHGYMVRAVDAHSWAQVYIAPYGWVPIDPTPGFRIPGSIVTESATIPGAQVATKNPVMTLPKVHYNLPPGTNLHHVPSVQSHNHPELGSSQRASGRGSPWIGGLFGMLILGLAAAGLKRWRELGSKFWLPVLTAPKLWRRIKWWSRWRLHLRAETLTPREWAAEWSQHTGSPKSHELALLLERGLYGPGGWSDEERRRAWILWGQLRFSRRWRAGRTRAS